ncbi:glycoside hydrolase family 16 protein [Phyllobacterium phragmitis]|uniref:Beta-glucanase n=1 Tax=Phyllobacterium phragmitis TaxID=2670329 RepID=A0ABQ0H1B7_9HYPH
MTISRPISRPLRPLLAILAAAVPGMVSVAPSSAQETGKSFVEDFSTLDKSRWYVSDGWTNGNHQNCTWAADQVKVADGALNLGYQRRQAKDREHVCGEIQTKARFSYGTYEARIKAAAGSGFNTGFFTYIGPAQKQPWDEIDFEFLGKDPSKVQLNTYVNGKGGNEKLVDVPGGADKDFNDYAFVWEKDRLRYYINGKLVHTVTDPAALPTQAQKIYLSLWASDNMKSWLGTFSSPASPVAAQFTRVAFTALGDPCQFPESVACSLD